MSAMPNPQVLERIGEQGERSEACPYLKRAILTSRYPIEGYCVAHPHGRLRVVTIGEFRELCTTAEYVQCQLYRELRDRGPAEEDPGCAAT
ncbi:MAG: hypothetical protein F9K13_04755 [Candidatus Methylomirabilis oxygeniifera]|uniref:Uncharacterized protein n=1 Tax=Methylomirabilis oxygeniifera TaxID=671143 RepID=D5MMU7_METO1|nr:MAG: hypothetical protein F9K13_04755 [Candidatus Methylomirabilis oxyfera]CBE68047.1 protein of unknown function [Candidatus Methylomirabilis oxyfera]